MAFLFLNLPRKHLSIATISKEKKKEKKTFQIYLEARNPS